jgi:hypothetical protein
MNGKAIAKDAIEDTELKSGLRLNWVNTSQVRT